MEHKHSDNEQVNFERLKPRIITAHNHLKEELLNQWIECLEKWNRNVLIMATGGSKVVANFLQKILEENGVLSTVIEPRDLNYSNHINQYDHLVIVSYSGTTNGVLSAIEKFRGKKYLITGNNIQYPNTETISYQELMPDKERSFISLASTLVPATLWMDAAKALSGEYNHEQMKEIIDQSIDSAKEYSEKQRDFAQIDGLEILSGVDTLVPASTLESNLIETGTMPVIVHDKGAYCHGRSTLAYHYRNHANLYITREESELDRVLKNIIKEELPNFLEMNSSSRDAIISQYELLLKAMYLSRKICTDKGIDPCQPEYNPKIIKKIYKYRGEM